MVRAKNKKVEQIVRAKNMAAAVCVCVPNIGH